jgi:UDP-glucose 4-epimerase
LALEGYSNRKILVTGGGGFIGGHLVKRLVSLGSDVISLGGRQDSAFIAKGVRRLDGDISRETLETVHFVPDVVFHLAGGSSVAASVEDPLKDFLKTVFSTVLLLDYLQRHWPEARLVYLSSAAIYGEADHTKASHDLACLPISPYGVHKKLVESLLIDHGRMYQTASVILRPFSVYGPGLHKQLLWDALQKAERNLFEFFGSGHELRDWVFISDLVDCILRASALASPAVPVLNAGTCRAVSIREIVSDLYRIAGVDQEPLFLGQKKKGDPLRLVADDSAESVLGPLFLTTLEAGLEAYVEWYRQRGIHD